MNDPLANPEVEAELLGLMMFQNGVIDTVADLVDASAFSVGVHGRIFDAAAREYMAGNPANPLTLKGYFEQDEELTGLGGAAYLMKLSGMASLTAAPDLARQISRLAKRRAMRDGLAAASASCADFNVELSEIIDAADSAVAGQASTALHQPTGAECFDEMIAALNSKERGVTGGIDRLDALLGPIKPKQVVICAARPGMGKTAVALSYGLRAAQRGHGVLFVSLEMSSPELATRMAADLCFDQDVDLPFNAIRDGDLNATQREWISKARGFIADLPFQVIDTGSLSVSRLAMLVRRHARRMAARGQKLELVIVDYLQLLQADRRGGSNYERISEVSVAMKAMAKDNGVGVLALAQLSRAVEQRDDKRPMLSDLRDSGQIEQDADAVLFLLRAEYYLRQSEPEPSHKDYGDWQIAMADARNKIEFILAKRRNGTTGSAIGDFHGAYQAVR